MLLIEKKSQGQCNAELPRVNTIECYSMVELNIDTFTFNSNTTIRNIFLFFPWLRRIPYTFIKVIDFLSIHFFLVICCLKAKPFQKLSFHIFAKSFHRLLLISPPPPLPLGPLLTFLSSASDSRYDDAMSGCNCNVFSLYKSISTSVPHRLLCCYVFLFHYIRIFIIIFLFHNIFVSFISFFSVKSKQFNHTFIKFLIILSSFSFYFNFLQCLSMLLQYSTIYHP